MSYDVDIGDNSFNYTYNLGAFFREHIPEGIAGLNRLTGRAAGDAIARALDSINRQYCDIGKNEMMRRYDAENGWGSVIGAITFISRIMAACYANPRKKVQVC